MNEQQQFLSELDKQDQTVDVLNAPLHSDAIVAPKTDEEEVSEDTKNRRHKRLEAKLQAEREANIELAARLEAISEAKKFQAETPAEYLSGVEKLYGTDSPEAIAATDLLKKTLQGLKESATKDALELFREERRKEEEAVKKEEARLDSMLEELEDEHNVDFTSNPELKKGFFKMLERLSPKDTEGNILYYADHHAVWDEYKSKLNKKTENRAKDLSDRSMVQSGAVNNSKLQDDADQKWLRDNGII